MCTSIVSNKGKTIIGWNLDILDMEHRVCVHPDYVSIEILDPTEGWMPLFGANSRGDFVAMPTCWPYDKRSDPVSGEEPNVIMLDIDLLLRKKSLEEIHQIAGKTAVCSVPGITFQSQLSDAQGNVLQLIPGQGYRYYAHPEYAILTNFSPFKREREQHPWMGMDRYQAAMRVIGAVSSFDVDDCFAALKAASQTVCPTVVSMVFDVETRTVYWCENREWDKIQTAVLQ